MSIATADNVREVLRAADQPSRDGDGGENLLRYGADAAETVQHRFVGRHGGRPLHVPQASCLHDCPQPTAFGSLTSPDGRHGGRLLHVPQASCLHDCPQPTAFGSLTSPDGRHGGRPLHVPQASCLHDCPQPTAFGSLTSPDGRHGGRPLQSGGSDLAGDPHAGDRDAGDRDAAETVQQLETVHQLREKLERYRRRRARQAGWTRRFIPTGITPLDEALPHDGLPCGAVTEILSDGPGVGALTLAVQAAVRSIDLESGGGEGEPDDVDERRKQATARPSDHRCLILIDSQGDFYPPAMCRYGVPLDRLVVLRPQNARDAFWAVDQSLRCSAVAAVIASLSRLDERASRRLQLAAESSGCLGLVLRSAGRVDKSFAAVRMLVEGKTGDVRANTFSRAAPFMQEGQPAHDACVCRITLLTVREGMPAGPFEVDLHDETGAGAVHPVPVDRSAAKTG